MREALREIDANGYGFPELVELTHPDRIEREERPFAIPPRAKPAWWLLYALLPLSVLVFGLADAVPATRGWHSASELFATLVVFLGIGLWLRLNRPALILADYADQRGGPLSQW